MSFFYYHFSLFSGLYLSTSPIDHPLFSNTLSRSKIAKMDKVCLNNIPFSTDFFFAISNSAELNNPSNSSIIKKQAC